jgi:hypothetical protein
MNRLLKILCTLCGKHAASLDSFPTLPHALFAYSATCIVFFNALLYLFSDLQDFAIFSSTAPLLWD